MSSESSSPAEPTRGSTDPIDVRARLIACLAFVVLVVVTPIGWWWLFGIEVSLIVILLMLTKPDPWKFLGRWLGFLAATSFFALAAGVGNPQRQEFGLRLVVGIILLKNTLAFASLYTLANSTPHHRILQGFARLGMPKSLVATLQFMYRSIFILKDELDRMMKARRSRTFSASRSLSWGTLSGSIGRLFLRSIERSERVHSAMLARGFDGTIRTLDGADPS